MSMVRNLIAALMICAPALSWAGSVNINDADADALATLKGVGPAKADAIVAYREAQGAFGSVDELADVKGIGEWTVKTNRDSMSVGEAGE